MGNLDFAWSLDYDYRGPLTIRIKIMTTESMRLKDIFDISAEAAKLCLAREFGSDQEVLDKLDNAFAEAVTFGNETIEETYGPGALARFEAALLNPLKVPDTDSKDIMTLETALWLYATAAHFLIADPLSRDNGSGEIIDKKINAAFDEADIVRDSRIEATFGGKELERFKAALPKPIAW